MAAVELKDLLEAGVHFGHHTQRWHPKMKPYIYGEKRGLHIIDLNKTAQALNDAYNFVISLVEKGGIILFIGTKPQARAAIEKEATRCGMPYINNRWLGGFLTNIETTLIKNVEKLIYYEELLENVEKYHYTKKELIKIEKEQNKLLKILKGVRDLKQLPSAVFIIDIRTEVIAVREAKRLHIPIIAVVDTNCDPTGIAYVIPGNDDGIKAISLFTQIIANAVLAGKKELVTAEEGGIIKAPADKESIEITERGIEEKLVVEPADEEINISEAEMDTENMEENYYYEDNG